MKTPTMLVFLLTSLLAIAQRNCDAADWSYSGNNGPDFWASLFPDCGGERQSPVDIDRTAVLYDPALKNIEFSGYDAISPSLTLKNLGKTVQCNIAGALTISGCGLGATYQLEQFHLHWGASNGRGSEHTLNGHEFDAELHFVHFKNTFDDVSSAAAVEPDGLAVLGVFIKIGQHNNAFENVVNALDQIRNKGDSVAIPSFRMDGLLPYNTNFYFRYQGSLTTPPCFESVLWTVFLHPISISQAQMVKLRTLMSGEEGDPESSPIGDNFRPPLPLSGQVIRSSKRNIVVKSKGNGPKQGNGPKER